MSKFAVGLIVSVIVVGNVITTLVFLRGSHRQGDRAGSVDWSTGQRQAIESLRNEVVQLSRAVAALRPSSTGTTDRAEASGANLATRLDELIKRLEALEKSIATKNDASDELAVLNARQKLLEQYRADDGFALAEELLAQGKLAAGANGLLTFLEAHPDHPDTQDLMRRARDAFQNSGNLDKALWLHGEIMKKYPEHRAGDLHLLALLEKRMK